MKKVLEAISLSKKFGPVCALTDVSFSIYAGEVVALIGDNGAGKSTVIKILSGVTRPDNGSLIIRNQTVSHRTYCVRHARRYGIETVHQERSLADKQPLWRNLFVGRHIRNRLGLINVKKEKALTMQMLHNSIGLKGVGLSADALAGELSGGERQGLAIGRAMHFKAALTILDEPTTALSIKEVAKVLEFVKSIPAKGKSALFVSHNLNHVHEVADRFLFIDRGEIVHQCRKNEMSITELYAKLNEISMPKRLSEAV